MHPVSSLVILKIEPAVRQAIRWIPWIYVMKGLCISGRTWHVTPTALRTRVGRISMSFSFLVFLWNHFSEAEDPMEFRSWIRVLNSTSSTLSLLLKEMRNSSSSLSSYCHLTVPGGPHFVWHNCIEILSNLLLENQSLWYQGLKSRNRLLLILKES